MLLSLVKETICPLMLPLMIRTCWAIGVSDNVAETRRELLVVSPKFVEISLGSAVAIKS